MSGTYACGRYDPTVGRFGTESDLTGGHFSAQVGIWHVFNPLVQHERRCHTVRLIPNGDIGICQPVCCAPNFEPDKLLLCQYLTGTRRSVEVDRRGVGRPSAGLRMVKRVEPRSPAEL